MLRVTFISVKSKEKHVLIIQIYLCSFHHICCLMKSAHGLSIELNMCWHVCGYDSYLSALSYFLIASKLFWQSENSTKNFSCKGQTTFTVITVSDTALIFWAETCNTLQLIPTSVLFNPTRPWLKHSHWHEWEIDLKTMPANGSWWLMGDCLID